MKSEVKSNIYNQVPWIPVQDIHGDNFIVTLRDLFLNSHNYVDFYLDSIPKRLTIQHFINFIAIACIRKYSGIEKSAADFSKRIVEYLDEYSDHFQLAGPKYFFLQQPNHGELGEKDLNSINTLIVEAESGNNGAFFTKKSDLFPEYLEVKEVIFALLQGHLCGFGGLGGGLKGSPTNYFDCSAARPLSVFVREKNLQKFIHSNAAYYYECSARARINKDDEENNYSLPAIWECSDNGIAQIKKYKNFLNFHQTFEKFGYERIFQVEWISSCEQPVAYRIKRAQGIHKSDDVDTYYPNLIYATNKKNGEIYNLKANQDKAVWRDLYNIIHWFTLHKSSPESLSGKINLEVLGFFSDQAKVFGSVCSNFQFSSELLGVDAKELLLECIEKIEHSEFGLKSRLKSAYVEAKRNAEKFDSSLKKSEALEIYWDKMGSYVLHNLLHKIPQCKSDTIIKEELIFEITKARGKAIEKFIQSFSDGKSKFKLIGDLYRSQKNEQSKFR